MFKKSVVTKYNSVIFFSVLLVSFCGIGVAIQQYDSSSRVVLKDELQINRKLLHNAAGEHACNCWIPHITNFAISKITSDGASITWTCSAPSTYQAKYGTTTAKDKYFPAATPTAPYTNYTVAITGLTPNTPYHVGPSSICISSCGNNSVNIRRNDDINGKSDWPFTTLPPTSITVNQNETSPTTISEARVSEITAKEVTILWKTNNPATSFIEYGKTTAYGLKSAENTIFERDHAIQLFDFGYGITYHARAVSKVASTGATIYSSDFTFTTPISEDRIVNQSSVFNEPNPCFDRTTFVYCLFQPVKRMTIDIFTLSGKMVATLEAPKSTLLEGYNKVLWDVRDNSQKRLATGLYMYRMKFYTANNQVEVRKSTLMIRK